MDVSLTIQEFDALLKSEEDQGPLWTALRKLMEIEKPEEVALLIKPGPTASWSGWKF